MYRIFTLFLLVACLSGCIGSGGGGGGGGGVNNPPGNNANLSLLCAVCRFTGPGIPAKPDYLYSDGRFSRGRYDGNADHRRCQCHGHRQRGGGYFRNSQWPNRA